MPKEILVLYQLEDIKIITGKSYHEHDSLTKLAWCNVCYKNAQKILKQLEKENRLKIATLN